MSLVRSIDWNPARAACDAYFMGVVKAACGITHENYGSLLSSVPVEHAFNDLRDAARRHAKNEVTNGTNLQSIVSRSCSHRNPAVETISVSSCDWGKPLSGKAVRKQVFDSSRASDSSLGLDTSGLTKKKSVTDFTKPHVFSQRLELLKILQLLWENGDEQFCVEGAFKQLWLSSLAERGLLLKIGDSKQVCIVLKGGPFSIRRLALQEVTSDEKQHFIVGDTEQFVIADPAVTHLERFQVCLATVHMDQGSAQLAWRPCGLWMGLAEYVAKHSILRISAGALTGLCSLLKLRGYSKLDHKSKIALFLAHFGLSQEYIDSVLAQVPETKKRAKKTQDCQGSMKQKYHILKGITDQCICKLLNFIGDECINYCKYIY